MAAGSGAAATASVRSLTIELMSLQKEPVEGFTVSLENDDDMYLWRVAIFGPPETPYEGGYFKVNGCKLIFKNINVCLYYIGTN